jgi:transposase
MGVLVGPANQHDSVPFEKLVDAVPGIRKGRGRPRRRFRKLHADKAYDFRRCRVACKARGMLSRIARRGVESQEKLGKHRWVVERTFAWFKHFRRLAIRYERRADIHLAFLKVAASMICLSALAW